MDVFAWLGIGRAKALTVPLTKAAGTLAKFVIN
jgi:hypothetical protein